MDTTQELAETFAWYIEDNAEGYCYCDRCESIRAEVQTMAPWDDCPDCHLGWVDSASDEGQECERCEGRARIRVSDD